MSRKKKKHMRSARHLKRCKKSNDRKSNTKRKDRSYYIGKRRNELIESRSSVKLSRDEMPWLDTIMHKYPE